MQTQSKQVLKIFHVNLVREFARALRSLAKRIRNLGDPLDVAAPKHLDQNLVSQRTEFAPLDRRAANHEESAHRIADSADHFGQQAKPDQLRSARNDPAP